MSYSRDCDRSLSSDLPLASLLLAKVIVPKDVAAGDVSERDKVADSETGSKVALREAGR